MQINLPNSSKDSKKEISLHDHTDSIPSNENAAESEKNSNNNVISYLTGSSTTNVQQSSQPSGGKETEKGKRRETKGQLVYNNVNSVKVPQFYYPYGKPVINLNKEEPLQKALQEISQLEDGKAYKQHMKDITKVYGVLYYSS